MVIADPKLNPAVVELGSFFRQPPEAVWRALTEPDLLQRWFLPPTGFAVTVGTRFRFTAPDSAIDQISCEVLASQPYEQLSYSWFYPRGRYPARYVVEWRLSPQGHGTRLLLTQKGFDIEDRRQRMLRNAAERSWKRLLLPRLGELMHH